MVGVNERLIREATSYPVRVEEKRERFLFVILFLLTLVDCEAGLLFYILIYYITPYFLLLYIY